MSASAHAPEVLSVAALCKAYGDQVAVDGITFGVRPGLIARYTAESMN